MLRQSGLDAEFLFNQLCCLLPAATCPADRSIIWDNKVPVWRQGWGWAREVRLSQDPQQLTGNSTEHSCLICASDTIVSFRSILAKI